MRRRIVALSIAAAVAVLGAGISSPALAAPAEIGVTDTGTVVVQLLTPAGRTLPLGGADVLLTFAGTGGISAITDGKGTATLTGIPVDRGAYYLQVTPAALPGYDRRTSGSAQGFVVAAGRSTDVNVTLPIGGTLAGTLIGPWSQPPAGLTVELYGNRTGTSMTTYPNRNGRYYFNGLPTDNYSVSVYPNRSAVPTFWTQDVLAEGPSSAAQHVYSPKHYVHSTYNLWVVLDSSDPDIAPVFTWADATVTATNLATGAVFTETADASSSARKAAQFIMPSGEYSIEITRPARAATPSSPAALAERYWYAGIRTPLATTGSAAARVQVLRELNTVFVAAP